MTQHAIYKNGDLERVCTTKQRALVVLENIRMTAPRHAMAWGTGASMLVAIDGDIYDIRETL